MIDTRDFFDYVVAKKTAIERIYAEKGRLAGFYDRWIRPDSFRWGEADEDDRMVGYTIGMGYYPPNEDGSPFPQHADLLREEGFVTHDDFSVSRHDNWCYTGPGFCVYWERDFEIPWMVRQFVDDLFGHVLVKGRSGSGQIKSIPQHDIIAAYERNVERWDEIYFTMDQLFTAKSDNGPQGNILIDEVLMAIEEIVRSRPDEWPG